MTLPVVNWYKYYKFANQPWIQYFPLPNTSAASSCMLALLLATNPMENYQNNESHLEAPISLSEFLPHHFPTLFMMLTASLTFIASPCRINHLKEFLSGLKCIFLPSEMNFPHFSSGLTLRYHFTPSQDSSVAAAHMQRASWNPKPSPLGMCPVLYRLIRMQCLKPSSNLPEGNSQ